MASNSLHARLAVVAAAAVLALAACAPSPSATPSATDTTTAEQPTQPAPAGEVPALLQFQATTLDGEAFDGASLYGTPTLLWFWAEWCPICNAEAPQIADALNELPAGVQVLGVPGRSGQEGMEAFVKRHGLGDVVQIVDEDGSIWANFSVVSQPALVVIDRDGNVQTIPGSVGKAGLLQAAESIA